MLYQNDGIYRYLYGVNWRALVTLLVAFPVNLPGLIHAIEAEIDIGDYIYFCEIYFTKIITRIDGLANTDHRQSIVVDSNVHIGECLPGSESCISIQDASN